MQSKQAMRAHALEEMLTSVQTTLDEQFFTSQKLHSSVMSQLQMFHTQVWLQLNFYFFKKKLSMLLFILFSVFFAHLYISICLSW